MKKIEAIIKPFKLDEVKATLSALDTGGLTISEVKGCGLQGSRDDVSRGASGAHDSAPKVKLEIIIEDAQAAQVASAPRRAAARATAPSRSCPSTTSYECAPASAAARRPGMTPARHSPRFTARGDGRAEPSVPAQRTEGLP